MARRSRKAPTLAALVLFTGCVLRLVVGDEQCNVACASIKAESSSSEACSKARKSLPRPKIGRVCQEAFDEAVQLTCVEACQLYGTRRAPSNRLGEVCNKRKREVPRPVAHKACVDGFKAGFAATTASVAKRIESVSQVQSSALHKRVAENHREMEQSERTILAKRNADMLKEADAERSTLDGLEKAQEAEKSWQEEQQKERARKAIEAKSAQVKREKEALTLKQELEAAKAVAESTQRREMAEEERQERIRAALEAPGTTSTGKDTAANVDSNIERETRKDDPIVPDASLGTAPGELKEDGGGAVGEISGIEVPNKALFREVLVAANVAGFETPSSSEQVASQGSMEAGKVRKAAEMELRADPGMDSVITLPNEASYREVLTVDHIKGYRARAKGDSTDDGGSLMQQDRLDSAAVAEPSREEAAGKAVAERKTGNDIEVAGSVIALPNEARYREVLTVDHIKGYKARAKGDSTDDRGSIMQQERLDSVAVAEPNGEETGRKEAAKRETEDEVEVAASVIALPEDARYREVLTVDHIKGYKARAKGDSTDDPGSLMQQQRLDSAPVVEPNGEETARKAAAKRDTGDDIGVGGYAIALPDEARYREVLTVDHIKGYKARANRDSTDDPRSLMQQERLDSVTVAESSGEETAWKAAAKREAGDDIEGAESVIALPDEARYREVLTVDHIKGHKARAKGDSTDDPGSLMPQERLDSVTVAGSSGKEIAGKAAAKRETGNEI